MDSKALPKEASKDKLEEFRRGIARHFASPVVSVIARTGISPNAVTWLGFIITVVAAVLAGSGYLLAAGLVSLAAAFCDTLDGALARKLNKVTVFYINNTAWPGKIHTGNCSCGNGRTA